MSGSSPPPAFASSRLAGAAVVLLACLGAACGAPARTFYDDLEGGAEGAQDGSVSAGGDATAPPSDARQEAQESALDGGGLDGEQDSPAVVGEAGADGAPDAPSDGGEPEGSAAEAGAEAGAADAAVESGCGPLDTVPNCGGCGQACDTTRSLGATCDGTTCHYTSCIAGYADCNTAAPDTNGCETPINTTSNCSACGVACDTVTSAGATCDGTTCHYTGCASGYEDCNTTAPNANGCETQITTTSNCGGCGLACDMSTSAGATCSGGDCHYTGCDPGYADCNATAPDTNGCETSIATTSNCSGCGLACDTINSNGATCNGTTCQYTSCAPGYADCVKTAPDTNGCETRTNTTSNCGGCGVECGTTNVATPGCNGAGCTYTCNAGYQNCNTTAPNTTGCECHTTGCCMGTTALASGAPGATCQVVHTNGPTSIGLGQTWDDCVTMGTYNLTQATAACYAKFGTSGDCQDGWTCGSGLGTVTQPVVCDAACTQCWAYATTSGHYPTTAGTVTACTCPSTVDSLGTWN